MEQLILADRCSFIAKVVTKYDPDWEDLEWIPIQCANEEGHVGDHLITVHNEVI
jgi:hypothetical protein